ncbi:MAG: lipoate--protein ligase family protein [Paludibacteraceae bacterium]|nr:lipoate--protein ligase family protein [Paludibacteraceae bacterium]
MKHAVVPRGRSLAWYLDEEIRLAQNVQEDLFFCWRVKPTVIYGRHQQREAEVNESYCRDHGIAVVQRKSGGGCVYADEGNLMLSFISTDTHSEAVFERCIGFVAEVLRSLGLEAVATSHNDILVGGRKVSGNACYALPNATIVHGTLLYDVNLDALEQAITPDEAKLKKHAVQSVRQRVTNIRPMLPNIRNIEELEQYFINHMKS